MNKIITILSLTLLSFMPAYAGVNIGASMNAGVFHGTGQESENGELSSEDATGVAAYASVFVEAGGERFAIGIDYVPQGLESETAETVVDDIQGKSTTSAQKTNKVQVDFEDLTTLYVALNVTENFYVKAGLVTVDVITKENLATGSAYGNGDLDGTMYGVGYHTEFGNGMFARLEGTVMDMGGQKLTSSTNSDNTVELKDVMGASGKISIGKSF